MPAAVHGFRGDAAPAPPPAPRGPVVAVSREAGARGGSVARRVGRLLGWPVFNQDSLDYLVRDDTARAELLADLTPACRQWADAEAARLSQTRGIGPASETYELVRLILTLAARGEAVVVGRGAGFVLPAASTVHVRVVAPVADRVAYMADWLRLTPDEAADEVRDRDRRREKFVESLGVPDATAVYGFDMVLNAGRLGEQLAAGIVVQAVAARVAADSESSAEFDLP